MFLHSCTAIEILDEVPVFIINAQTASTGVLPVAAAALVYILSNWIPYSFLCIEDLRYPRTKSHMGFHCAASGVGAHRRECCKGTTHCFQPLLIVLRSIRPPALSLNGSGHLSTAVIPYLTSLNISSTCT